jgi:hypothetical protein
MSHTILKIAGATDSFVTLQRIAKQLFAAFRAFHISHPSIVIAIL